MSNALREARRQFQTYHRGAHDDPVVRQLEYTEADSIDVENETFDDELVEGVLARDAMAVEYGDSNSGKTFLAIDLGAAICRKQKWHGRPTVGGLVLYLATEAAKSVRLRLKAYRAHHQVGVPGFCIVQSPINLFDGDADVTAVLALVTQYEALHGDKVVLIIGDTLSRISSGANENSGEDMGVVLRNADRIRAATGATFLWIHHTGKEAAKGARGWSGIRAAIDTEIEVTSDDTGTHTAEVTKQRDGPKGARIGFQLLPVIIGRNRWGTERTSCVVLSSEAPGKTRGRRPSEIVGAIVEVLTQRGSGMRKSDLAKHFEGRYKPSVVYRELKKMREDGRLLESVGVVALPTS